MNVRRFALACCISLLVSACGEEPRYAESDSSSSESAAAEGANQVTEDGGLTIAEREQQRILQERLDAQAEAAEQKLAAQAARNAQAEKAAAQKGAQQSSSGLGLTPEQEKKRQAILDQKAAIRAGGGKPAGYTGPAGEGPRLRFTRTDMNFGEVWDTDTMTGSFEFQNTGKSKLVIDLVKASCGCTTTELDRMEFEPGEGSKIDVEWHPKGFGPQVKTITITSNNEGELYTRLMIRANIKPFAKFDPEPTRFNNVRIFEEHTVQTVLTCVDPNFELVSLKPSNPHLSAVEVERKPNGDRVIELTLDDTTPWGMFNASVIAKVRGVRQLGEPMIERDAIVHVGASIFGDLEVTPNLFSVGRVAPRGRISFSVVLKSADGKDFELTKAVVENSQPPGMTLRSEPNPGGGLRVFVEGDVGDHEGLIRGTAVMETNLEGEGERRLPVMGIVRN